MDEIASSHSRPRKGELLAANPSPSIAPEFANAIARDRVIPRLPLDASIRAARCCGRHSRNSVGGRRFADVTICDASLDSVRD